MDLRKIKEYIDDHSLCSELLFRNWEEFLAVLYANGGRVYSVLWWDHCRIDQQEASLGDGGYRDPDDEEMMFAETDIYENGFEDKDIYEVMEYIRGVMAGYPDHELVPSFYQVDDEKIMDIGESKKSSDLKTDGILGYGLLVGRFVFKRERRIIYAVTEYPHVAGADVFMNYQISREGYDALMAMSLPNRIPIPEVPLEVIKKYERGFLCGESAYCQRSRFSLADADPSLAEAL